MDLFAYSQMEAYQKTLKDNGIEVPRPRGVRAMWLEKVIPGVEMVKASASVDCVVATLADEFFHHKALGGGFTEYISGNSPFILYEKKSEGEGKDRIEWDEPKDILWDKIPLAKAKKLVDYIADMEKKRLAQFKTFNKYIGRKDVLMVHARIGGDNWKYYDGPKLRKEPWFIAKVDDWRDSTYCDIYVRIKPEQGEKND